MLVPCVRPVLCLLFLEVFKVELLSRLHSGGFPSEMFHCVLDCVAERVLGTRHPNAVSFHCGLFESASVFRNGIQRGGEESQPSRMMCREGAGWLGLGEIQPQ